MRSQVSPTLPVQYLEDTAPVDAVPIGKILHRYDVGNVARLDVIYGIIREFMVGVPLSRKTDGDVPILIDHILRVVRLRPEKEVVRSDAHRIVTVVADTGSMVPISIWYLTEVKFPGDPVSSDHLVSYSELPVPFVGEACIPLPTSLGDRDLAPKSLQQLVGDDHSLTYTDLSQREKVCEEVHH